MIYAIHADGTDFVKFGITNRAEVALRLSNLQCGNPHQLVVLALADWPDYEEARIHRYLRQHKVRGEWFRLCPQSQAVIDTMDEGIDAYLQLLGAVRQVQRTMGNRLAMALTYCHEIERMSLIGK